MVSVCDQGRALQPVACSDPDAGGDSVCEVSDRASRGERTEASDGTRVDEAFDRLEAGDAGAGKDREHHREPCPALRPLAA